MELQGCHPYQVAPSPGLLLFGDSDGASPVLPSPGAAAFYPPQLHRGRRRAVGAVLCLGDPTAPPALRTRPGGGLRHRGQGWLLLKSPRLPTKPAEPGLD